MVRVQGPMFSFGASGTIGNAAVFSTWKGRHYVRERIIPSNPRSAAQHGMRSMLRFLSKAWANIDSAKQDTWGDLADAQAVSKFNAYVQWNQRNWRNGLTPIQGYPPTWEKDAAPITSTIATASGRDILVAIELGAAADQWGVIIFVSQTQGFSPNWNNARYIAAQDQNTTVNHTFGPFDPGTYYLRYWTFSTDGKAYMDYVTEDSVTVE